MIRILVCHLILLVLAMTPLLAQSPSDEEVEHFSGPYELRLLEWDLGDWEGRELELPALPTKLILSMKHAWYAGPPSPGAGHLMSDRDIGRRARALDFRGDRLGNFSRWWSHSARSFTVGAGGLPGVQLFGSVDEAGGLRGGAIYVSTGVDIMLGRSQAFPQAVLELARAPCLPAEPGALRTFSPN